MTFESDAVAAARRAYLAQDFDGLGKVIATHPLEVWFGMPPSEAHTMLGATPPSTLRRHPTANALLRVLASAPLGPDLGFETDETAALGGPRRFEQGISFGQAAQVRLAGDPVRSFTMMRGLGVVADAMPYLIDSSRGERTFALVQTGVSGMLAGRFPEALAYFEKSLVPQLPAGLAFLNRDAHVRSAMIHALYGDPKRARTHLAAARLVPRTQSWVEPILDSDERLVVALLRPPSEVALGFDEAASTTVGRMHELWPIHVAGISLLSVFADQRDAGRRRIQEIADAGLAQVPGVGFTGSIITISLALDAILSGAVSRAQQMLEGVDQRLWLTKLLLALAAVGGGAHAKGLRMARAISTQTRDLPQADAARLLVVALAHHGLGATGMAIGSLRQIPACGVRLCRDLLGRFSSELLALAAAELPDWASDGPVTPAPVVVEELLLTDRELEVLEGLARGDSREQIARTLFLSVNTVKTHQRSLYRKLGATNAHEAIEAGRRRGLV